ncbi:hypothetical protein G3M53_18425, partial [Streptomyces sp. SID7982]|nr:hypothetical protein [Streptomyces sp. SID7982]
MHQLSRPVRLLAVVAAVASAAGCVSVGEEADDAAPVSSTASPEGGKAAPDGGTERGTGGSGFHDGHGAGRKDGRSEAGAGRDGARDA